MTELSHGAGAPLAARHGSLRFGIALAAGVAGAAIASALGVWQMHRADAKLALQSRVEAAARAAPLRPDADDLAHPDRLAYRHLEVSGRWLPNDAIFLDNRPWNGRAGFYLLMPLALDTPLSSARSVALVVNRGWLPRDAADRARIAPFVTPPGIVRVAGVALADEPRLVELGHGEPKTVGGIWQNFDFDSFTAASRIDAARLILRQDADAHGPSTDGLVRDWPDRGGALQGQIDRHHGYAFQWFALAAVLAALTLFQSFRHVRARARAQVRSTPC